MSATDLYIAALQGLKPGDLGRLRKLAGLPLDASVDGFDLFAGLWWPLREKHQRTPRREVAWLVARLYACTPLNQSPDARLAPAIGRIARLEPRRAARVQRVFDDLLLSPLHDIEPHLRWALALAAKHEDKLDWVRLTDDLWRWEREQVRQGWANDFLETAVEPSSRSVSC